MSSRILWTVCATALLGSSAVYAQSTGTTGSGGGMNIGSGGAQGTATSNARSGGANAAAGGAAGSSPPGTQTPVRQPTTSASPAPPTAATRQTTSEFPSQPTPLSPTDAANTEGATDDAAASGTPGTTQIPDTTGIVRRDTNTATPRTAEATETSRSPASQGVGTSSMRPDCSRLRSIEKVECERRDTSRDDLPAGVTTTQPAR